MGQTAQKILLVLENSGNCQIHVVSKKMVLKYSLPGKMKLLSKMSSVDEP